MVGILQYRASSLIEVYQLAALTKTIPWLTALSSHHSADQIQLPTAIRENSADTAR
jgi:hypothetical protein